MDWKECQEGKWHKQKYSSRYPSFVLTENNKPCRSNEKGKGKHFNNLKEDSSKKQKRKGANFCVTLWELGGEKDGGKELRGVRNPRTQI